MEAWASSQKYRDRHVQFLCVCVESPVSRAVTVARAFANMFRLQTALNCYIPGRGYFPVGYGQLGCSGFIVVDAKGRFISRKTKAFLQYGEAAFSDVERLLDQELQEKTTKKQAVPEIKNTEATVNGPPTNKSIKAVECPPSTGVAVMDHEHADCTKALNSLLQNPSMQSLTTALKVLEDHFRHEEELLLANGFGGSTASSFSPLTSHRQDHERILQIGRDVLATCEAC